MSSKSLTTNIVIILMFVAIFGWILYNKKPVPLPSNDWVIVPNERIGPLIRSTLTKDNIEQKVREVFGISNVSEKEFYVGEGESVPGFTIYPESKNEIQFRLEGNSVLFRLPGYNDYFYNENSLPENIGWHLDNGLKIGSSFLEVQKANSKVFSLYGFGWDYGGTLASWEQGKLPHELSVVFEPTENASYDEEQNDLLGDQVISSDTPALQKAKPIIKLIYIQWNFN